MNGDLDEGSHIRADEYSDSLLNLETTRFLDGQNIECETTTTKKNPGKFPSLGHGQKNRVAMN